MDITVLYKKARVRIEKAIGTYKLFQIDDKVEDFCLDELLRLIEQGTRTPHYRSDLLKLPRWQQLASYECMAEFHEQMERHKAERLAAR